MAWIGLAPPAEQELLGGGFSPGHDLVGNGIGRTVGDAGGARDDRHHLRGEPAEVLAGLVVGDLVELAQSPESGEVRGLSLQICRSVPGEARRLVQLRIRHLRFEVVIDEETPDVLIWIAADELLDVDAAIAQGATFAVGFADLRLDGDHALETGLEILRHGGER